MLSALGDVPKASVTAGHSAAVFSVGSATATVTAPEIVQAVSYSTLNLTVGGVPKLLEVMSTGTLTMTGSAEVAHVATFGDYSSSSSLTVDALPLLWVMGDLAGSVTADQITGVRVFDDLTGTVVETGAPFTLMPLAPPDTGVYFGDEMAYYPYSLVVPLEFGAIAVAGVQVLHDITSSGIVTPPPVAGRLPR